MLKLSGKTVVKFPDALHHSIHNFSWLLAEFYYIFIRFEWNDTRLTKIDFIFITLQNISYVKTCFNGWQLCIYHQWLKTSWWNKTYFLFAFITKGSNQRHKTRVGDTDNPIGIYIFKVKHGNTRTMYDISKTAIKLRARPNCVSPSYGRHVQVWCMGNLVCVVHCEEVLK